MATIGIWQGAIEVFDIQKFLLPAPSDIASTLWDEWHTLGPAGWYTFKEAVGGFVVGSSAGIVFALVVARFRGLGAALLPIAIAANAVPVIAFAPIFNVWFNPLEPTSKMAIAAVLCFFPVMVNTLRGLTSVQPRQIELMRAYAAGEIEIFRRVRIPTALPYIFTALKLGERARDDRRRRRRVLRRLVPRARRPDPIRRADLQLRARRGRASRSRRCSGSRFYLAVAAAERAVVQLGTVRARMRHNQRQHLDSKGGCMKKRWVTWAGTIAALVALAVAVGGGASAAPTRTHVDKVTLQLKWVTQAQFAGYYAAKEGH